MFTLDFKVAVAQMRPRPGDIRHNLKVILDYIERSRTESVKLVVFPELCTSGYMLGDRWEHDSFISEIAHANEEIRKASKGLGVIWGSIRADWDRIGEDGRVRKYNAALIADDGEWLTNGRLVGWIPKTNLPKYRIFDDARHFYPADKLAAEMKVELSEIVRPFTAVINGHMVTFALAICEDLWEDEYNNKPSLMYAVYKPDLLIDISQSPWTAEKWHARDGMLTRRSKDAHCPILYVNAVGLQNNAKNLVWFDGNSSLINEKGEFTWRAPQHQEGLYSLNPAKERVPVREHTKGIEEIFEVQITARHAFYGLFPRVVVGLSGGIDSAVEAALNVLALGPEKVLVVNMPTRYNSQTTRNLAELCARNLGVEYRISTIQSVYEAELDAPGTRGTYSSMLVRENIQARARGHRLARIAADEGGVFTCNGNKTEVALNYFTLYGDGAGAAAFLADLWKGQIYALARYINQRVGRDVIPQGIIDIVPSAELSPEQNVDEGKGDPIFYPYHDNLLRMFIERRWDPTVVVTHAFTKTLEKELGCERGTIEKYFPTREAFVENLEWCWTQYNKEFKRHQLPPVFITSRRAFGFDRRDTIADGYFTDAYKTLRDAFLKQTT